MSVPIIQVLKFLCLIVEYVECINANQRYFPNNLHSNRKLNFPLDEFCHSFYLLHYRRLVYERY